MQIKIVDKALYRAVYVLSRDVISPATNTQPDYPGGVLQWQRRDGNGVITERPAGHESGAVRILTVDEEDFAKVHGKLKTL